MPIVEVKGVGQAQFPDGMSQEQIKDALQKKFTPDYNFDIPERYSFAKPSELSMQDKVKGYLFDVLMNNKIISNPYSANKIADNLSTILSFLPGTGTAFVEQHCLRRTRRPEQCPFSCDPISCQALQTAHSFNQYSSRNKQSRTNTRDY